jgi:type I restriction enzyme S subunit
LGKQCINSLARGAVRERMLFNRLAEGRIDLPDYEVQLKASAALANIKSIKANVKLQMEEINTIPERLLVKAFEKDINV